MNNIASKLPERVFISYDKRGNCLIVDITPEGFADTAVIGVYRLQNTLLEAIKREDALAFHRKN